MRAPENRKTRAKGENRKVFNSKVNSTAGIGMRIVDSIQLRLFCVLLRVNMKFPLMPIQ